MTELTTISRDTDFEEIAAFQRRAFGYEWLKSERRRLQRAEYYRWKYFPPAGPAWLATIRSQQELVAMAAVVPFGLADGEGRSTAWQICDIATHPQFRNRGFFARCLAAIRAAVVADVTFCFPNKQSRAGLIKAGYAVRSILRLRARPLLPFSTRRSGESGVRAANLIDCDAAFARDLGRHHHIQRTPEFLRWRYATHPLNRYVALRTSPAESMACVIVRHLFDGRMGLVVDISSASDEALRAGQEAARQWAKTTGCSALLWTRGSDVDALGSRSSIGGWQQPCRIVCYARSNVVGIAQQTSGRLQMQLGDWDAV
jgi:GNAT superfamily N-acetyltransferase